jgi:hypothetical protein
MALGLYYRSSREMIISRCYPWPHNHSRPDNTPWKIECPLEWATFTTSNSAKSLSQGCSICPLSLCPFNSNIENLLHLQTYDLKVNESIRIPISLYSSQICKWGRNMIAIAVIKSISLLRTVLRHGISYNRLVVLTIWQIHPFILAQAYSGARHRLPCWRW